MKTPSTSQITRLCVVLYASSNASAIALSGYLNLTNSGGLDTNRIVIAAGGLTTHPHPTGYWTLGSIDGIKPVISQSNPSIVWNDIGHSVLLTGTDNSSELSIDAFQMNGKLVAHNIPFHDGVASIPNSSTQHLFVRLNDNSLSPAFSSRTLSDSTVGNAYVILNGDTLQTIPITTWTGTLPDIYIVQRNIGIVVPSLYSNQTVQAVYWSNDSIARVVPLGQGTSDQKYSGFVTTAYTDSQYSENSTICSLFARIINPLDSTLAYTRVTSVKAQVGNLDYDSTQFLVNNHIHVYGYSFVKNDSDVANYSSLTKVLALDSVFGFDTLLVDSIHTGVVWQPVSGASTNQITVYYTQNAGDSIHIPKEYSRKLSNDTTIICDSLYAAILQFQFHSTVADTIKFDFLTITPPNSQTDLIDTIQTSVGIINAVFINPSSNWTFLTSQGYPYFDFQIAGGPITFENVRFVYRKTTYFYH